MFDSLDSYLLDLVLVCRNGGGFYYDSCEFFEDTSECFISLNGMSRVFYDRNKASGKIKSSFSMFQFLTERSLRGLPTHAAVHRCRRCSLLKL